MDWKKIVGWVTGLPGTGNGKPGTVSMVILIAVFLGGMAVGKWACQGKDTIVTVVEKIPVPASSGEKIVDAVKVQRDSIAVELKKLQEKLRRQETGNGKPGLVDSRPYGPEAPIEAIDVNVLPEILMGRALFPDSALGRIDTVEVTSYGAPINKMDIALRRARGEIMDLDTVRVPPPIIEGVEFEWVAVIGLSMFIFGAVTLGR